MNLSFPGLVANLEAMVDDLIERTRNGGALDEDWLVTHQPALQAFLLSEVLRHLRLVQEDRTRLHEFLVFVGLEDEDAEDDAPPPADPALLASANRALAEQVERLEANATDREGVLRRERELWRKAERERDALRDAARALVALDEDSPEADAAWASLCRLLTPTPTPTETTT